MCVFMLCKVGKIIIQYLFYRHFFYGDGLTFDFFFLQFHKTHNMKRCPWHPLSAAPSCRWRSRSRISEAAGKLGCIWLKVVAVVPKTPIWFSSQIEIQREQVSVTWWLKHNRKIQWNFLHHVIILGRWLKLNKLHSSQIWIPVYYLQQEKTGWSCQFLTFLLFLKTVALIFHYFLFLISQL